jgi:hypothetical protein
MPGAGRDPPIMEPISVPPGFGWPDLERCVVNERQTLAVEDIKVRVGLPLIVSS